jgi:hypothetical protein
MIADIVDIDIIVDITIDIDIAIDIDIIVDINIDRILIRYYIDYYDSITCMYTIDN